MRELQTETRGGRLLSGRRLFWLAAIITIVADLASKHLIFQMLGGGPPPDNIYRDENILWILPGAFRLVCHYNTGGAFGFASGNMLLFFGAAAILIPALVLTAYYCREPGAPLWALGLVVGGAIGNLYDRMFHVGVRDFLEIMNPRTGGSLWPIFNIADVAIVFGVSVYLIWSITDSLAQRRLKALKKQAGDGGEE